MNLLPRSIFFLSMLPLSPPPGYFKEINSIISKFIWNDKCPRIKLTTLQHPNSAGGLAVPNFELCYWSFQLKALHNWVDPQSTVSWRVIEADKVKPNRLQDILFTGTGKKGDNSKFGPVVANSIKIWKTVERRIGGPFKFCNSTPLWHNLNFVCGNRPFVQPSWSSLGVNKCGDMYDNQGLCSFQALRAKFCLPASAYFVFLQLRSALKAYGVPWSSYISLFFERLQTKLKPETTHHECTNGSSLPTGHFLDFSPFATLLKGFTFFQHLLLEQNS